MKIFHVITTINRGGAENHLKDLIADQIRQGGIDVSCAYLKGDAYWAEALKGMGCQVHALEMDRYGQLAPAWRLRKLIKAFAPDVVHAHLAPAELYTRLSLLGDTSTPLVISRHNHNRFYGGFGAEQVERWVVSRAQRFIGISESVMRHFSKSIPEIADRFEVVPYGIDTAPVASVSRSQALLLRDGWGIGADTVLLGTVARLVPVKALHTLLEGYARLRVQSPSLDIKLALVGAGPLEADLKARAVSLGLGDSVVWAGFRQDIPVVMNAIDVFVLTSLSEGFGLVLLEAMSASKPVISTNVSALPEIVVEGETGLMVPPENPGALASAMQVLVQDAGMRERFGKAGFERAVSNFSLDAMFRKTVKIYEQVLQQRKIQAGGR